MTTRLVYLTVFISSKVFTFVFGRLCCFSCSRQDIARFLTRSLDSDSGALLSVSTSRSHGAGERIQPASIVVIERCSSLRALLGVGVATLREPQHAPGPET